ncbi:MAG: phosphoenolpyruvate carboxykinase, partial [Chthoniobacter sp.]|nr:phosphoenolpyruvate carboxykinase [Chthoniobacter sp.]
MPLVTNRAQIQNPAMNPEVSALRHPPGNLGRLRPKNEKLLAWIEEMAVLCEPDQVFWCDGSDEENAFLLEQAVAQGVLQKLNQEKLPGCYYHRSNPNDVARVEQCTFICTPTAEEAGPTNNWAAPAAMYEKMRGLLAGSMRGRTMFVVPYLMGPAGSPVTKVGVELTDSIYVVLNMRIMTRMGQVAYAQLGDGGD